MRVTKLGEGEPEVAIVGCIHGEEKCGTKAIERLLKEDFKFKKPVKLIVANEKALEAGERCVDTDLNRCFPGNKKSELHEERLAAEILDEIEGMNVLDLHSTRSETPPFVFFIGEEGKRLAKATGLKHLVDLSYLDSLLIGEKYINGIAVECGTMGTEKAAETAYNVSVTFLANMGVLEAEEVICEAESHIYKIFDEAKGSDLEFKGKNFQRIEKGEKFAENEETVLEAKEDFYPVLMSDDGYQDKVGFKAELVTSFRP